MLWFGTPTMRVSRWVANTRRSPDAIRWDWPTVSDCIRATQWATKRVCELAYSSGHWLMPGLLAMLVQLVHQQAGSYESFATEQAEGLGNAYHAHGGVNKKASP